MQTRLGLALADLLRRMGHGRREEAHALYLELRGENPHDKSLMWNHSLLLKQWGSFEAAFVYTGQLSCRGRKGRAAPRWNTGICAVGAGQGARALEAWRSLNVKLEMGEDGLPDGQFPNVQGRISSRGPLCDPTREPLAGEPGFEYGWVEPRSPCHGVLLTPLIPDEPADVGDLILWDGAPVREKILCERKVFAFPLLAVLRRGGFLRFHFRAEQLESGLIGALQDSLPKGVQLYVHDEHVEWLCTTCGTSPTPPPHAHAERPVRRFVSGKLAIPPRVDAADVQAQLRESLTARPAIRLAVPALHRHLGDLKAAAADEELWRELAARA